MLKYSCAKYYQVKKKSLQKRRVKDIKEYI